MASSEHPFSNWSQDALRILFLARAAVSRRGGASIQAAHLAFGLLAWTPDIVLRGASEGVTLQHLKRQLNATIGGPKPPQSQEVPFSVEARAVLETARKEAAGTLHPEHLLLALVMTESHAAHVLRGAGITETGVRDALSHVGERPDGPSTETLE